MRLLNPLMLMLLMVSWPSVSAGHDSVWPGDKLKTLSPRAESFEQKNLYVSDEQRKNIETALGSILPEEDLQPSIYFALTRSSPDALLKRYAAIIFIDAYGKGGKIEMGVVVSGRGDLEKVLIFENNESESLRQPTFLEQFAGKRADAPFKTGGDITFPAREKESAQAIAAGAKRGVMIINEVFKKK